jgi:hypothetical protein
VLVAAGVLGCDVVPADVELPLWDAAILPCDEDELAFTVVCCEDCCARVRSA